MKRMVIGLWRKWRMNNNRYMRIASIIPSHDYYDHINELASGCWDWTILLYIIWKQTNFNLNQKWKPTSQNQLMSLQFEILNFCFKVLRSKKKKVPQNSHSLLGTDAWCKNTSFWYEIEPNGRDFPQIMHSSSLLWRCLVFYLGQNFIVLLLNKKLCPWLQRETIVHDSHLLKLPSTVLRRRKY